MQTDTQTTPTDLETTSAGASSYWDRYNDRTQPWKTIGARHYGDVKRVDRCALQGARNYAKKNGLTWPLVPDGVETAYEFMADNPDSNWSEAATASGLPNGRSAYRSTRNFAVAQGLPWPPAPTEDNSVGLEVIRNRFIARLGDVPNARNQGLAYLSLASGLTLEQALQITGYKNKTSLVSSSGHFSRRWGLPTPKYQSEAQLLSDNPDLTPLTYLPAGTSANEDTRSLKERLAEGEIVVSVLPVNGSGDTTTDTTMGREAYELRSLKMTWTRVARECGTHSVSEVFRAAETYAQQNGLAWPLTLV